MAIPVNTQERIDLMSAVLAGSSFRVWRVEEKDSKGRIAGRIMNDAQHLFDWAKNNYELVEPHQIIFIKSNGVDTLIFSTRQEMRDDTTISSPTIRGRFITGSREVLKLANDAGLIA